MPIIQNRRHFMAGLAAGSAGLVAAPSLALAEPPPETTSVRLGRWIVGATAGSCSTSLANCSAPTA